MTVFSRQTLEFLKGIAAHNEKAWFEANRPLYEAGYVAPAKAFVSALGERLRAIAPDVHFEPKINGSIGRINRDIRFSKDKRPYKDHLDLWFWLGDTKGWDRPGFWFSLSADKVFGGTGIYQFMGEQLDGFRQSAIHPRVRARRWSPRWPRSAPRATRSAARRASAHRPGWRSRPSGPSLLLYEGPHAGFELPSSAALEPDFIDQLVRRYAETWPIGKWIADEVAD